MFIICFGTRLAHLANYFCCHLTTPAAAAAAACAAHDSTHELPGGLGLRLLLCEAAVGLERPEVRGIEPRHHERHLIHRHRLRTETAAPVVAALTPVVPRLQG